MVARQYMERGIRLDSVPGLVTEGLKECDRGSRRLTERDTAAEEVKQLLER